jgi:hypothetical protein
MINQPAMGDRNAVVGSEAPKERGAGFGNTQPNVGLREGNAKRDSLPGIDNGTRVDVDNIH